MGAVTTPRLGCEFDSFLYASVGTDGNGMPLTVLSALARMDVDPWDEAAKLMQLPQDGAVKQLASLLGSLRNTSVANLDPARIAVPLVALLPRPLGRAPPLVKAISQAAPAKSPAIVSTLLSVLTYVIFMLFINWLMMSLQAPRQKPSAATSAPTPDAPTMPTAPEADSQRSGVE